MQNVFFIWIPSIQQHLFFKELSGSQYKIILKNIDDSSNLNFIININNIIKENLVTPFPYESFTILDRFIIFTYLKIQFAGSQLKLSRECSKCSKSSSLHLDLEHMLNYLSDKIDKSFSKIINISGSHISLKCDIPSIRKEWDSMLYDVNHRRGANLIDVNINNHFSKYINEIIVPPNIFDISIMSDRERTQLIERLPFKMKDDLQHQFIDPLFVDFDRVVFFKFECGCGENFELKMSAQNTIELIKLIYRDNTLESWLRSYVRVAKNLNVESSFLDNLTNTDIDILDHFIDEIQSDNSSANSQPLSQDLFSDYASETQGMKVSPSEF